MPAIEVPERFQLTPEQFERLALTNETVRLELTAKGKLLVMPPTGFETGDRNSEINAQLRLWANRNSTGRVVDSSTLFALPNGARRSPDAAWISNQRIAAPTKAQRHGIPPLVPDFVIELASPNDLEVQRYADLQAKVQEYIDNGTRLGWLIEPEVRRVEIYRPG